MTSDDSSSGFIDIHCHLLPGLDDGPDTAEESVAMATTAREDGITHIFATPHYMPGSYENKAGAIREALTRLREQVPKDIELLPGSDVRIMPDLPELVGADEVATLAGSPYQLIEFPEYAMPPNVEHLIFQLRQRGLIPILTHPERCPYLLDKPKLLKGLRGEGVLCQVTALSITGGFGREIKKFTLSLIDKGQVEFVATDSHGVSRRPPVLSKAYREVLRQFDRATADRLFYQNPRKILDAIPPSRQ